MNFHTIPRNNGASFFARPILRLTTQSSSIWRWRQVRRLPYQLIPRDQDYGSPIVKKTLCAEVLDGALLELMAPLSYGRWQILPGRQKLCKNFGDAF
jgi:hypothetical protein